MKEPGRFAQVLKRAVQDRGYSLLRDLALEARECEAAKRRMVSHFATLVARHSSDFALLDLELGNIYASLDCAHQLEMEPELTRMIDALFGYLETRGLYCQAELHLVRALRAATSAQDREYQAILCDKLGFILIRSGRLDEAEQHLQQGVKLAQSAQGSCKLLAQSLGHLGLAAFYRGDYATMDRLFREAMVHARASGNGQLVCRLLEGWSESARRRGDYGAAEGYCREALTVARQLKDPELLSLMLKGLAVAIFEHGGCAVETRTCLQESLAQARQLGHPRIVYASLLACGHITGEWGEFPQAEAYLNEALDLMNATDFPMERVFVLCTMGLNSIGSGEFERANGLLQEVHGYRYSTALSRKPWEGCILPKGIGTLPTGPLSRRSRSHGGVKCARRSHKRSLG